MARRQRGRSPGDARGAPGVGGRGVPGVGGVVVVGGRRLVRKRLQQVGGALWIRPGRHGPVCPLVQVACLPVGRQQRRPSRALERRLECLRQAARHLEMDRQERLPGVAVGDARVRDPPVDAASHRLREVPVERVPDQRVPEVDVAGLPAGHHDVLRLELREVAGEVLGRAIEDAAQELEVEGAADDGSGVGSRARRRREPPCPPEDRVLERVGHELRRGGALAALRRSDPLRTDEGEQLFDVQRNPVGPCVDGFNEVPPSGEPRREQQ